MSNQAQWSKYPNFSKKEFDCLDVKDISGYEGLYCVSTSGIVYSYKDGKLVEKSLSQSRGYPAVTLYNKGKSKRHTVHRLVALTFINNPDKKKCVNHIDGDKCNNNVDNLEWVTHGENKSHSFKVLGEIHWMKEKKGDYCPWHKKIVQIDLPTGEVINTFSGSHEAHRSLGISQGNISAVCRGLRETAGGFGWRFYE